MKQVIIWGPPCSGKSTYAKEHAQDGDLVWDADTVQRALTGCTEHRHDKSALGILMGFRSVFLRKTAEQESEHTAYCIVRRITDKVKELAADDAETVFCDVPMEECLTRLQNDDSRPDKEAWEAIIRNWFAEYERDTKEAEMSKTVDFQLIEEIKADEQFYNWATGQYDTIESKTSERYFVDHLAGLTERDSVNLYINSMGGSYTEALGIYSRLQRCPAKVTAYIDGFAASAASVIAMAADKVVMPRNTCMMIHKAAWGVYGTPDDLRKSADDLDVICDSVVASYKMRVGDKIADDDLADMLAAETWLSADRCIQLGLADEYGGADADLTKAAEAFQAAAKGGGVAYAKAPAFLGSVRLPAAHAESTEQKPQAEKPETNKGSVLNLGQLLAKSLTMMEESK